MGILKDINRFRIQQEDKLFSWLHRISLPLARIAFFAVFFWFGTLKMMELSPSIGVIHTIHEHTAWFIPWELYVFLFGAYECLIGVLFLVPGRERWVLYLLIPHVVTTFAPLLLAPKLTWKAFLIPNMIGQYIIKNVVIVSLAIFVTVAGSAPRRSLVQTADR
ncbi:MAG: hypothetical protein NZL95_09135 [Chitinophagales bacterium]|nr:hypothetical protein [Chitinophagales bacterium]MDW8428696.1 hypothetical protein [Chitinophagales bacterium]